MTNSAHRILFAGGYAPADQAGIHAFDFNELTGNLSLRGSYTGIANPSFLAIHPNRRWLYAVSETGIGDSGSHGAVCAFQMTSGASILEPINDIQSTNGDWPCHLQIDATGRWIIASNYGTGDAAVFPILEDGGLGEMEAFVKHFGSGPNQARQESPHAHSTTFTPDNDFAIVADLGIDQLVIYAFNEITGGLSEHALIKTRLGAGPRHMTFHPNGQWAYVANELDSTVAVYEYDTAKGTLREQQILDTLPEDAPENIVADIHVSSSGERIYVSNRGHNSIAVYAVGGDGRLTGLTIQSCGGNWPRNFTLSADGRFMLVANEKSNEIAVLPILTGMAELGQTVAMAAVSRPTCLQFMPEDERI